MGGAGSTPEEVGGMVLGLVIYLHCIWHTAQSDLSLDWEDEAPIIVSDPEHESYISLGPDEAHSDRMSRAGFPNMNEQCLLGTTINT